MSTIRERDAADMTPGGMQRVWRYSVEDLESGEFVEVVPVDCYADRRALLVAGDALANHLRLWIVAPRGTHICTCRGTGINPARCWHCTTRDLLATWAEATE